MKRLLSALVVAGIVVSAITQSIQYVYAATAIDQKKKVEQEKRRIEKEYARVLYLFSENKLDLTAQFLRDKQYVAGYQAYRNKDYSGAKGHFRQSIDHAEFVPESRYLLAYMYLLENEKTEDADLSEAMKEVTRAIEQDRDYAAAYNLRGILEVRSRLIENGLDDLKIAVTSDGTACYDIQQYDEINRWWGRVAKHTRFLSIQTDCRAKWGIPQKATG